ncbi:MarR family winged helix-turn-helix transcriptional regulator [Ramlibacter sp. PS4R-6]|uniref:MarR family winged helix-turn-helix transcriptional regulator n=1 Tax=Ramlibacter sp. PS4R-6 TaxID=3133438 RepID=UPI00309EA609
MFDHCLYFNTTALARVVEKEWTAAFKPFGVTPSQGFLLRLALARPGLSQYEMADELTISRPTATRLIDGLQALGLLERREAEHDGRHWSVHPTRKAREIEEAINAASGAVTRRIQQRVGRENFQDTVGKVRAVCSALK